MKNVLSYSIVTLMVLLLIVYKACNGLLLSVGKFLLFSLNYLNSTRYVSYNEVLGNKIMCLNVGKNL